MSITKRDTVDLPDSLRDELLAVPSVRTRLEFQFALLSAAGGVVLASGQGTEGIALLAVFSAVVGFVFVDWLRLIELPPIGAYLAMAGAAVYCVQDFWGLQQRGEPQMVSVALLLVLVQGVLMMQRKSRRILEQLAVFCLLELVVAAIFSDAIGFGVWMIPIAIVGASALSLLGLVTMMESLDVTLDRAVPEPPKTRFGRFVQFIIGGREDVPPRNAIVATSSPESVISIYWAAGPWSRYALLVLSPAVIVIAAAFFYVLPRRVQPSRSAARGPAMVGFDDEVRMEQLGQVMQNSDPAVRVKLTEKDSGEPYLINDSLYLRGKVLEDYQVDYSTDRPIAKWISTDQDSISRRGRIPSADRPRGRSGQPPHDRVHVKITCEAMSRPALFSIAPYHQDGEGDAVDVVHAIDRWTLARESSDPPFPRISYEFGTRAFLDGVQTRRIAQASEAERMITPYELTWQRRLNSRAARPRRDYEEDLLRIDRASVPTAVRLATQVLEGIGEENRRPSLAAVAMEQYLKTDPAFSYTLNLDATPIPGVDPVEQFLSVDRRGHCQYFASALALMLRSVGIPCRVVVGYRTEEYNNVGKYYIARQLHAHAWVEALIERDQESAGERVAVQRRAPRYWMRLDPTPAESALDDGNPEGVDGLLNLANNVWEDYVVEMDRQRQSDDLVQVTGLRDVRSSYQRMWAALQSNLAAIRAGRLEDGEIDLPLQSLAISAFIVGAAIAMLAVLLRLRLPQFRRRVKVRGDSRVVQPRLPFYAETLKQLGRAGVTRGSDETPSELLQRVGQRYPDLQCLTDAFERCRYGQTELGNRESIDRALSALTADVEGQLLAEGAATGR
ncbi:Protein-glutamine gamma-glutamyltransferase [Stieleria neptunia]|uniref:Protein-glutamine gamma-glutamyltransferase n=1 Tax=Stieleria neptunia TaxID=2527979 RepID=A0A518HKA2_9BACT|nr:transglutaminaseTgpA domain-containing protein [Stieleria neptunia]QDV41273.1 Protein-glutamine gamma-glutamyltransferase [Stieleria neptunia]